MGLYTQDTLIRRSYLLFIWVSFFFLAISGNAFPSVLCLHPSLLHGIIWPMVWFICFRLPSVALLFFCLILFDFQKCFKKPRPYKRMFVEKYHALLCPFQCCCSCWLPTSFFLGYIVLACYHWYFCDKETCIFSYFLFFIMKILAFDTWSFVLCFFHYKVSLLEITLYRFIEIFVIFFYCCTVVHYV